MQVQYLFIYLFAFGNKSNVVMNLVNSNEPRIWACISWLEW